MCFVVAPAVSEDIVKVGRVRSEELKPTSTREGSSPDILLPHVLAQEFEE